MRTWSRRALLDVLAAYSATQLAGPAYSASDERLQILGAAVRADGDAGLSSWGEAWSSSCSWGAGPTPLKAQAELPSWLAGRWSVKASIEGVKFPMGRKYLNEKMPGVRMASILPLPNIGNEPTFEMEYGTERGGAVVPARGANAAATLEAYWPAAKVLDVETPSVGRLLMRYESPTRSMGRVSQSVDIQLCASEGGPLSAAATRAPAEWVTSEVFRQDNIEQGIRGEYTVLSAFARADGDSSATPSVVRCRQRIAAFLQPTDGAYFDVVGKPVALYDYNYVMTRVM